MKIARFVGRIIKKQKILNVILVIEMAVALVLLSILLNRYTHHTQLLNKMDCANISKSLEFVGKLPQVIGENLEIKNETDWDKVNQYLVRLKEVNGISDIRDETIHDQESEAEYEFTTYDKITAQKFRLKLSEGVWITEESSEQGVIPTVVVNNGEGGVTYHIGDEIKGKEVIEDESGNTKILGKEQYVFRVVGIVTQSENYMFAPYGIRNYTATFEKLFPQINGGNLFFIAPTFSNYKEVLEQRENAVIYLDQETSNERVKEIKEELSKFGYCDEISDMRDMTVSNLNKKLRSDFPTFFSMLCISIIGMVSISMLNIRKQKKDFSVYSLCGCSKRRVAEIYFFYLIVVSIMAFISYIFFMRLTAGLEDIKDRGIEYLFQLSTANIGLSLIICLGIVMVSSIIPFILAKKSSVIGNYYVN